MRIVKLEELTVGMNKECFHQTYRSDPNLYPGCIVMRFFFGGVSLSTRLLVRRQGKSAFIACTRTIKWVDDHRQG
jgi:hypothetical protein